MGHWRSERKEGDERRTNDRKNKFTYNIECDGHRPPIATIEHLTLVPIVRELKVRRPLYRSCIEPALLLLIHVHIAGAPLGRPRFPRRRRARPVLDAARPRHTGVPQRSARGHEERVKGVPGVREHEHVEVQEPRLLVWEDAEVRRMQRRVRERLVQERRQVGLEVVERGRG